MQRTTHLTHQGLTRLKQAFRQAQPIQAGELQGFHAGEPAGPWWFRLGSTPTMYTTGFGGWMGKQFMGDGRAVNQFQVNSGIEFRFPMTLDRAPSRIDGIDTLVLIYPKNARAPWCWVIDELRRVPDGRILGMTFVDVPLIKHQVFPFVLTPPHK